LMGGGFHFSLMNPSSSQLLIAGLSIEGR